MKSIEYYYLELLCVACWLASWPSRPIQESKVRFPVGAPGFQTHFLLIKCLCSLATLVLSYPIKNAADVDNRPLIITSLACLNYLLLD